MMSIRVGNAIGLFGAMVDEFEGRSWENTLKEDYSAILFSTNPFELIFEDQRSYCWFMLKWGHWV